jgi:hypothetical protein
MKLSVKRGGGVAGFVTRTDLETEALSPEDAETLQVKVEEAGVREMTDEPRSAPAQPGDLAVEVTIEDEGDVHTVRLSEAELPESVRSLIAWADQHPESKTGIATPGDLAPPEEQAPTEEATEN